MVAQLQAETRAHSPMLDGSDARLRALTEHALEIITVQSADGDVHVRQRSGGALSRLLGPRVVRAQRRGVPASRRCRRDARTFSRLAGRAQTRSPSSIASNTASAIATAAGSGSRAWPSTRSPIPPCSASSRTRATSIAARPTNASCRCNHARYRTVADLSEGAVHEYLMNAQGVYELEWTLGAERVYGCSDEEYRRRGWQSFLVGDGWREQSLRAHRTLPARRDRRIHRADPPPRRRSCAGSK